MRVRIAAILAGLVLAPIAAARGQEIVEFPLPASGEAVTVASGLALGPDGNVWFSQNILGYAMHSWIAVGDGLASITDAGVTTAHPCGAYEGIIDTAVGGPAATPDGNLWITEDGPGAAESVVFHGVGPCLAGAVSGATLPSYGTSLIAGPDGNLWLILPLATPPLIARSATTGILTTFALPAGTTPNSLAAGPDGNIWFTDFTNRKVGRMTMAGSVTLFDLVTPNAAPGAITAGPDGKLWFVESNVNQIGRITTTGSVTEFLIPTPASQPAGIAVGADGALWFTEWVGKIGRITTAGVFSEIRVPYANASPDLIIGKPDGTIWFTDVRPPGIGANRIGRLSPSAGCIPNPQTLCLNIGAFSVTASFQTTPEGPSAPANAVALTGSTGYFWFFDPANVEMIVKVLDGCEVNGHYWVFAGRMTNVGVEWKVTDTRSSTTNSYSNPAGTPFQPVQDTAAFPCP